MTKDRTREQGPFGICIGRRVDGVVQLRGSGAVIGPNLVLTSWHVVNGQEGLVVLRGPDGEPIPVTKVLPAAKPRHDVALLRVDPGIGPAALFSTRAIGVEDFEADGYAKINALTPSRSLEQVAGRTLTAGAADTTLNLGVEGPPEWSGMSGAAVRIGERIVAVIRGARGDWAPAGAGTKRITATPLSVVWQDEAWFREALVDRKKVVDEYDRHRTEIRAMLEHVLKEERALGAALAAELSCTSSEVPDRLLEAPGQLAAEALCNSLARVAEEGGLLADLDRFQRLWARLIPLMADLRELAVETAEALSRRSTRFELNWRDESLAEVVLAAAESRACRLIDHPHRANALWGEGFQALPPALEKGAFRYSSVNLEDALRTDLTSLEDRLQTELGAADVPRLDQAIGAQFRMRAKPTLRLVLVDADLGEHAAELWQITTSTLSARLPSLHLLRLKGGVAPTAVEEGALHEHLKALTKATRR